MQAAAGRDAPPALAAQADAAGEAAWLLRLLSHPARLRIVCLLAEGEHSVSQIEHTLAIHQPTLSQQLTVLRKARLVATRRDAKQIFYQLTPTKAARLVIALHAIFCDDEAIP